MKKFFAKGTLMTKLQMVMQINQSWFDGFQRMVLSTLYYFGCNWVKSLVEVWPQDVRWQRRTSSPRGKSLQVTQEPGRVNPTAHHTWVWWLTSCVNLTSPLYPVFVEHQSRYQASLIAQLVKNLPAMQETLVWFLGREDQLEKRKATHSNILGLPLWLSW